MISKQLKIQPEKFTQLLRNLKSQNLNLTAFLNTCVYFSYLKNCEKQGENLVFQIPIQIRSALGLNNCLGLLLDRIYILSDISLSFREMCLQVSETLRRENYVENPQFQQFRSQACTEGVNPDFEATLFGSNLGNKIKVESAGIEISDSSFLVCFNENQVIGKEDQVQVVFHGYQVGQEFVCNFIYTDNFLGSQREAVFGTFWGIVEEWCQ